MKKQFTKTIKKNKSPFSKYTITSLMLFFGVILLSGSAAAQQTTGVVAPAENTSTGLDNMILLLFICTIVLLLVTIFLIIRIKNLIPEAGSGAAYSIIKSSFFDKFNASVAIEKEEDILMDHEYDGIKELDNNLPPWWKYGFYLTILIAVCYLTYFHFLGGDLQITTYEKSLKEAKASQEAYQKEHGDVINEDNVKLITDKDQLAEAEKIFKTACFVCHGAEGQGNAVGPNLTDDYWIHGGSIKNVFHTITNGWPEKGMQSWKTNFSPLQISQLASYVKSLRGTNPANPKEKQGDLYVEEGAANIPTPAKDSTSSAPNDGTKVVN